MAEEKNIPQGANKYSIYAQRNVESTQVDWAKIAGTLTKGAETIRDERQTRKDAIDKSTQEAMDQLSKVADVNDQDAASLLINGSNMSTEALRVQSNMLKRGLIKPKDFKLFMQQQKNGYSNLSTAVKGWDKWATQAMNRLAILKSTNSPEASEFEIELNKHIEGLGNLKNKKLWSNPINGQMHLVTMGKDKDGIYNIMPDYETQKEKFQNPNTMNNLMKFKLDRFDLKNATKRITGQIGTIIDAERRNYNVLSGGGGIDSRESFRQFGNFGKEEDGTPIPFENWKEKEIDAVVGPAISGDIVSGNTNAGSLLLERGYHYAQTIDEFKERYPGVDKKYFIKYEITSDRGPVMKITATQQKEARRIVNSQIESEIDEKLTKTKDTGGQQKQQDSPNTTSIKNDKNKRIGYAKQLAKGMSASTGDASATFEDLKTKLNEDFKNSRGQSTKQIQKIGRGKDMFTIKQSENGKDTSVTIQRYEKNTSGKGFDKNKPRPERQIALELYRNIIPKDATDMSFEDFYKEAIEAGVNFAPRMVDDGTGTMIPNEKYKGDEDSSTVEDFDDIPQYRSSDEPIDPLDFDGKNGFMTDDYAAIPSGQGNYRKAAPVVMKSVERGLATIPGNRGVSVTTIDTDGSTNDIVITYNDSVTGKKRTETIRYDDDNTKLQGDVDTFINNQIAQYNESKRNPSTTASKKTISQITKENPNKTPAEIIVIFKAQ